MSEKTNVQKRRKYDADFKSEVIKMVASGRSVVEVSQALGIGENLIYRWKKEQRDASLDRTKGKKEVDVWQEVDQLRERLRQTEMERDILKKALAIFSRMT
jgi:transposase